MNVLNLLDESAQWRKPVVAPPAPYTATPYVDQQVNNAFGEAPTFDPNAQPVMQVVPQEETPNFAARYEENLRNGLPALSAILKEGTPPLDEKRQQRLKLAAGWNALGQGMSTLYGGYIGSKGGPILAQENNFTPAALKEYNDRINADNEAKYRNAMAKFQFGREVYGQTSRQMEEEQKQKNRVEHFKLSQEFNAQENEKKRQVDIIKAKEHSGGLSKQDQIDIINQRYDRMEQLKKVTQQNLTSIENLRQQGRLTLAEANAEKKKELESFKANKTVLETETEDYTTGTKTKTQKSVLDTPADQTELLKPNQNPSRQPNEPNKKEIDLSGIPGAKIGFKPKGSPKYKIQTW